MLAQLHPKKKVTVVCQVPINKEICLVLCTLATLKGIVRSS
jgi:hypothetical protein